MSRFETAMRPHSSGGSPPVMSMARTIKLLGWTTRAKGQINDIRQEELEQSKRYKYLDLWIGNLKCVTLNVHHMSTPDAVISFLIPLVTMFVAYSTYVGSSLPACTPISDAHTPYRPCYSTKNSRVRSTLIRCIFLTFIFGCSFACICIDGHF
jgi:hypothetical protein